MHEKDLLPHELALISSHISRQLVGEAFRNKANDRIAYYAKTKSKDGKRGASSRSLSYEDQRIAERFLTQRLGPLLELTRALASFLSAGPRQSNRAFCELVEAWEVSSRNRDPYRDSETDDFFRMLGS